MGKVQRKKKVPVTNTAASGTSRTPQSTRSVIRRFHVLLKEKAKLEKQPHSPALSDVQNEIDRLGGLEEYQRMSSIGQGTDRGGGSEKVLIAWLKDLGYPQLLKKGDATSRKLKLLEVGALKPDNYASCSSWIEVLPLDLNARHPNILKQDFLEIDVDKHASQWHVVSLSLVLNFVPEVKDRAKMLSIAHSLLRDEHFLFLALPLPCIMNSRYLDVDRLNEIMVAIGFKELKHRWKENGKMAYWLFQKVDKPGDGVPPHLQKKCVLRQGNRNNFCILL